jgi:hypothetical protein
MGTDGFHIQSSVSNHLKPQVTNLEHPEHLELKENQENRAGEATLENP